MTPDEEEAVRRLLGELGDARLTVPPDVAARLDDVLSGLASERGASEAAGGTGGPLGAQPDAQDQATEPERDGSTPGVRQVPVADLAARRRRRWPQLLVAAAAVSVVGLGVGNVLTGSDSEQELSTTDRAGSGSAASNGDAAQERDARPASPPSALAESERQYQGEPTPDAASLAPPRLRSESLRADVQRVVDLRLSALRWYARDGADEKVLDGCRAPSARPGDELLAVRLDGARAVLVLRAPREGRREADVFGCADPSSPVVETTVEAR